MTHPFPPTNPRPPVNPPPDPDHPSQWNPEDEWDMADWPTAPKTIESIRAIVDGKAAVIIDDVLVDMWTANAILTVWNACTDEQRAKLWDRPIEAIGKAAWRLVSVKRA